MHSDLLTSSDTVPHHSCHLSSTRPAVASDRPEEFNTIHFAPDMINPILYDPENFKSICVDGVSVPMDIEDLASFSPSFSPTPTKRQPPDGNLLHAELTLRGLFPGSSTLDN